MESSLADFRIENDSVVLLSFTNGSSYRVNPRDLERHLSEEDLTKVRQALKLRKQFMRSVLPPTAMIVLILSVVGMGGYDMRQISSDMRTANRSHSVAHQSTVPVPTTTTHQTTSTGGSTSSASSQSGATSALPQASASGKATTSTSTKAVPSVGKVSSPPTSTVPSVQNITPIVPSIVPTPVKNVVQPLLSPITAPLTKALPVTSQLLPPGL